MAEGTTRPGIVTYDTARPRPDLHYHRKAINFQQDEDLKKNKDIFRAIDQVENDTINPLVSYSSSVCPAVLASRSSNGPHRGGKY